MSLDKWFLLSGFRSSHLCGGDDGVPVSPSAVRGAWDEVHLVPDTEEVVFIMLIEVERDDWYWRHFKNRITKFNSYLEGRKRETVKRSRVSVRNSDIIRENVDLDPCPSRT